MRSIGSLLVGLAALLASTSGLGSKRLMYYCAITSIHGFLQALLLVYVPITSQSYGFEWYVARLLQILIGLAYTEEVLNGQGFPLSISIVIMIGLMFGFTEYPKIWFNWLAWAYSLVLFVLGTAIVRVEKRIPRIMGVYWILTGCWNYAFLRLSTNADSMVWSLNWWLPSMLSFWAFVLLAAR